MAAQRPSAAARAAASLAASDAPKTTTTTAASADPRLRRMLTDDDVLPVLAGDKAALARAAIGAAGSETPEQARLSKSAAAQGLSGADIAASVRLFGWFAPEDIPAFLRPAVAAYASAAATLVQDPRDIIFVTNMVFYFATIVPSAVMLLARFSWLHAVLHTVALAVFTAPFILMLHCLSHRKIASKSAPWLDHLVHVVLSPFFGETWNTFYYHHVKHHHVEDNNPLDLSSTIWYDRDNAFHFLLYFARFYFLIVLELPVYFIRKGRYQWAFNCFAGEVATLVFYASFFWLLPNNPNGVIFAWFVPFNLARFGMMSGNWAQHAFVEHSDPTNDYKTSITCLATFYNKNCFNDGYHTSHHLNPIRRWDEHPQNFVDHKEKYDAQTTVVFRDLDFHGVWVALMLKDYDTLAKSFVQVGEKKMTHDELKQYLRARTKRLPAELIAKHFK